MLFPGGSTLVFAILAEEEFFGAEFFYCVAEFSGGGVRLLHRG